MGRSFNDWHDIGVERAELESESTRFKHPEWETRAVMYAMMANDSDHPYLQRRAHREAKLSKILGKLRDLPRPKNIFQKLGHASGYYQTLIEHYFSK